MRKHRWAFVVAVTPALTFILCACSSPSPGQEPPQAATSPPLASQPGEEATGLHDYAGGHGDMSCAWVYGWAWDGKDPGKRLIVEVTELTSPSELPG